VRRCPSPPVTGGGRRRVCRHRSHGGGEDHLHCQARGAGRPPVRPGGSRTGHHGHLPGSGPGAARDLRPDHGGERRLGDGRPEPDRGPGRPGEPPAGPDRHRRHEPADPRLPSSWPPGQPGRGSPPSRPARTASGACRKLWTRSGRLNRRGAS
jgi:hypothetical protein